MFASARIAGLAVASFALAGLVSLPETAAAQSYGYGQTQTSGGPSYGGQTYGGQTYGASGYQPCQTGCGYNAPRRRYNTYNGQADVPGDYRCDAYWDASRTDCNAVWRDQRGTSRRSSSRYGYGQGYGHSASYGSGYAGSYGGGAVYPGQYGQPDVIYSGGGYAGGAYPDRYGHDHSGYGQGRRDQQRIDWCCAEYRSYDPATGYYTAYSGERIFCG